MQFVHDVHLFTPRECAGNCKRIARGFGWMTGWVISLDILFCKCTISNCSQFEYSNKQKLKKNIAACFGGFEPNKVL